jgi:hypothetical protein
MMNLREGTRRLALLLGVAGAIAGGFVSYLELQTVLDQRACHNRFEQLAASDVVRQEREKLNPSLPDWQRVDIEPFTYSGPNRGGIKTIAWGKNFGVRYFETEDGQTLYPTPAPAAWEYLLVALFPFLGFFIPWGAIRAIGWVGAGFIQPAK